MKARVIWIGMVVGLLLASVATQGVLIIASINDPSFAVEPDYERKAAAWDEVQRQRETNRRLGWTVDLETRAGDRPGRVDVELALFDRYGEPMREAAVLVETFHNARASHIVRAALHHLEDGVYTATLPLSRSGLWEFRLRVQSEGEVYTQTVRKSVLSTPRAFARPS